MLTVQDAEGKLREELEKTHKKPGRGSTASLDYLKVGSVALAMNEVFGPCGWDVLLNDVKILREPYRVNGQSGMEDTGGTHWNAIAFATVTVKARALFRQDGTYVEVTRQDVGVGSAVSGKQPRAFDAIQNALTSAVSNAFKRACRFFGPKTGLLLQFEPGEREALQRALDEENRLLETMEGGAASIEGGTLVVTDDLMSGSGQQPAAQASVAQVTQAAQAAPVAQIAQTPTAVPASSPSSPPATPSASANGVDHGADVLANFVDAALLGRIKSLATPDASVSPEDLKLFAKNMATAFGAREALGIWKTAGVTPAAGVVVKKRDLFGVAQVIEEASVGGGLEAFLAQFRPTTPPAAVQGQAVTPPPQAAVAAAPEAPVRVEGVKYDSEALKTASADVSSKPVVPPQSGAAPAVVVPNTESHGEQVHRAWDESSLGIAERRTKYSQIFGTRAPEVVELLAVTPEDAELTREDASKIHGVGMKLIQDLQMPPADIWKIWAKAGFKFGGSQPRGRHIRLFAENLPR